MKKSKHYTFVIVPHEEHRKMHSISLPAKLVHGAFFVFIFIAGLLAGSICYNAFLTSKTSQYEMVLSVTAARAKRIDHFEEEAQKIKSAVLDLHARNNQLRQLLGLKIEPADKTLFAVADKKLLKKLDSKERTIHESLLGAAEIARADQEELKKLKQHVTEVYAKMSSVPSKWPVYGRISSGYGYRVSPWRGMHTGVDIKASYGYPIRATAPGVVSFSGWRSGYGRTVVVQHEYGFSTLYAHCSSLLVIKGEKVEAGKIVGRVGVSGYSTGAHLHYEVLKDSHPINPMAFLNLKVLTAARILK